MLQSVNLLMWTTIFLVNVPILSFLPSLPLSFPLSLPPLPPFFCVQLIPVRGLQLASLPSSPCQIQILLMPCSIQTSIRNPVISCWPPVGRCTLSTASWTSLSLHPIACRGLSARSLLSFVEYETIYSPWSVFGDSSVTRSLVSSTAYWALR